MVDQPERGCLSLRLTHDWIAGKVRCGCHTFPARDLAGCRVQAAVCFLSLLAGPHPEAEVALGIGVELRVARGVRSQDHLLNTMAVAIKEDVKTPAAKTTLASSQRRVEYCSAMSAHMLLR